MGKHVNRTVGDTGSHKVLYAVAGAALVVAGSAQTTLAVDSIWTPAIGGNFSDGSNWSTTPNPPGAGDVAIFNNNLTGTVAFTGPVSNAGLNLRNNTGGVVTFDLNGNTYTLTGSSNTGLNLGTTAANASSGTKLILTDGTVVYSTTISVGAGSTSGNEIQVGPGTTFNAGTTGLINVGVSGLPLGNNNTLRVTGPGTSYTTTGTGASGIGTNSPGGAAAESGDNNSLIISNGASYTSVNNIYVGGIAGTLGADALPNNWIIIDGATYNNTNANRGFFLRDGTLRIMNNAYVSPALLNMNNIGLAGASVLDFRSGTLVTQRWNTKQTATFTIGDGVSPDRAEYQALFPSAYVGETAGEFNNVLQGTSNINLVLNTNGWIRARGTIGGSVSALGAGAKADIGSRFIANVTQPGLGAPTNLWALNVTRDWDNTNIDLTLDLGDFPAAIVPPQDQLNITQLYTHGGSITIDLQYYVPPQDQDHTLKMIGWGSVAGTPTTLNFINGSPLAYDWLIDGLYLTATVPSATWNAAGSGNWSEAGNWMPAVVPDGIGQEAIFAGAIGADSTVSTAGNVTVGKMRFNHPTASYTIGGPGTVTFQRPAALAALLSVEAGAHEISAAVNVASDTQVDTADGTSITLNSLSMAAGKRITKVGGGTLSVDGPMTNGANSSIAVDVGTVNLATDLGAGLATPTERPDLYVGTAGGGGPVAEVNLAASQNLNQFGVNPNGTATLAAGGDKMIVARNILVDGRLNMNDNDFIVDYDVAGPSPEFTLRDKVKAFADNPAATSGISFIPGAGDVVIAVAEKTEWGMPTFNGVTLDDTTVIGKYTYYGDANLDGAVTSDDYVAVDVGLGTGDSWVQGDFNFSSTVTSDDYVAIDVNLGKGTPTPLAFAELKAEMIALHTAMFGDEYVQKLALAEAEGYAALVPEPGSLSLVGLGVAGLLGRRRRARPY